MRYDSDLLYRPPGEWKLSLIHILEQQLRAILPPEESNDFCHRLVLHGRAVCIARRPQCQDCVLRPWCDYFMKNGEAAAE